MLKRAAGVAVVRAACMALLSLQPWHTTWAVTSAYGICCSSLRPLLLLVLCLEALRGIGRERGLCMAPPFSE